MNRITLATVAALALSASAPAFANDQLANTLRVEPGVYTTSQLTALKAAKDDGNSFRINQILKAENASYTVSTSNSNVNSANANLSRLLGVEPGAYTTSQLTALKAAKDDGDSFRINQILKSENPSYTVSTSSSDASSANANLSRLLGVQPGAYTTSQLTALKAAQDDGNSFRIHQILKSGAAQ
ncbi:hypothetical protein [Tropicimonas sp. IMCC34043]|uniref:hypothetical protein n=1 Tax=Tropicimonas sp. IMCC34043 TaxID=2248760 RepID=UPI000E25ABC4|nr:hypothetical protein [Tropicimonas sp. IMCC34043]